MHFRTKKRPNGSSYVHPVGPSSGARKGSKALKSNLHRVKCKTPKNEKDVEVEEPEQEVNVEEQVEPSTSDVTEQEDNAEGDDVEQKEATKVEVEQG